MVPSLERAARHRSLVSSPQQESRKSLLQPRKHALLLIRHNSIPHPDPPAPHLIRQTHIRQQSIPHNRNLSRPDIPQPFFLVRVAEVIHDLLAAAGLLDGVGEDLDACVGAQGSC
jgi:hypothetical protein